jgi:adenylate cyclase
MPTERRLAAIMFTDIVGYTALMAESEEAGLRARERHRQLVRPLVERHHGESIEARGDESLSLFPSALDAVRCALAIQAQLEDDSELSLHLGIHLGDVVVQAGEVSGDGVNIASRICALSEGGDLCVSGEVYQAVRNQPAIEAVSLGEHVLKNVGRPVAVYALTGKVEPQQPNYDGGADVGGGQTRSGPGGFPVRDGDGRPAIAVLPFDNLTGDPDQEYFADGIVEDLITRMTRWQLRVVARNSSFAYKGRPTDVRQIGRELGARYVVEGSIRRSANRVRVAVQLIDAVTGDHVCAERWDRELGDLFSLQDEIVLAVLQSLGPGIQHHELSRARGRAPATLAAWDSYARALWHRARFTSADWVQARRFAQDAVAADGQFVEAQALLAIVLCDGAQHGWVEDRETCVDEALGAARKAIHLDAEDHNAQTALGVASLLSGEKEAARLVLRHAVDLAPENPSAYNNLGWALAISGRAENAIPQLETAIRVGGPRSPVIPLCHLNLAIAHFALGDDDEALSFCRRNLQLRHNTVASAIRSAALAHLGRLAEARHELINLPFKRVSDVVAVLWYVDAPLLDRVQDGLRKAGLPEDY